MNLYELFRMAAAELAEDPECADIVVSDREADFAPRATRIRSFDYEKIFALINGK